MPPLFADQPQVGQGILQSFLSSVWVLYAAAAVGVVMLLLIVAALARWGRRKPAGSEDGFEEDLSDYPMAPRKPGSHQLTVHGRPVRLRLVVVAPVGKQPFAEGGAVEALLDQVLRGLGQAAQHDKPRVRTWPPQLSQQGFAPTFFRRTRCPDRAGAPSHWVMAAGPARAGGKPVLLGLAMWGDDEAPMEQIILAETEWDKALQVKNT
jgi:hypothetical protein